MISLGEVGFGLVTSLTPITILGLETSPHQQLQREGRGREYGKQFREKGYARGIHWREEQEDSVLGLQKKLVSDKVVMFPELV